MKKNVFFMLIPLFFLLFVTACNFPPDEPGNDEATDELVEEEETVDQEKDRDEESNMENDTDLDEKEEIEKEEEELALPDAFLQKDDENDSVRKVQEALMEIGYPIEPTEIVDQETIWALTDIQLQHDGLAVTGFYEQETKQALETILDGEEIEPGAALEFKDPQPLDEETVEISNPYEVLALINKQHALPSDYTPENLVIPDVRFPFVDYNPKQQMRKIAADALEEMFAAADEEGLGLFAQSGYRSYQTQSNLFTNYVATYGEAEANTFSARPGESEHQSGLTMDVTSPAVNYQLVIAFGETAEGKWLKENAADYGFIIRYPEGKEEITQYQYEPWHIRYVGEKAAKEIMEQEITLEEYLGVQ